MLGLKALGAVLGSENDLCKRRSPGGFLQSDGHAGEEGEEGKPSEHGEGGVEL